MSNCICDNSVENLGAGGTKPILSDGCRSDVVCCFAFHSFSLNRVLIMDTRQREAEVLVVNRDLDLRYVHDIHFLMADEPF